LNHPDNADIWWLRSHWKQIKAPLLKMINEGNYVFSPMQHMCKENGQFLHIWSSQDALVLKILTNVVQDQLVISKRCTHVKGHGGLKQTVSEVQSKLKYYEFVCKTDVKGYYESIDHFTLLNQIADQISNRVLRNYCYQAVRRTVEYGGTFKEIERGISSGCALSPLLGALYLKLLDDKLSELDVYYVRYMDDILIMTRTRWQNRRAVVLLNQIFNQLKVKQHPDKTFIGRIEKGFDFLGYHFSTMPLTMANISITKHLERVYRLYEQQKSKKATSSEIALVLGQYVKRWLAWCQAGLVCLNVSSFYEMPIILKLLILKGLMM
jgi:hypothetical protein